MAKKPSVKKKKVTPDLPPVGEGMMRIPEDLPVLSTNDVVAFPSVMMSLQVETPKGIAAVERAAKTGKLIFIVAQKNENRGEVSSADELYEVGVVAQVVRMLKLPESRYKVLLQGVIRAKVHKYTFGKEFIQSKIEPLVASAEREVTAAETSLMNRIRENLQILVEYEHLPEEIIVVTEEIDDPGTLADVIFAHYRLSPAKAQAALEELSPLKRLKMVDSHVTDDLNSFFVQEKIRTKTQDELSKGQKEYFLREQLKQIQKELGEEERQSEDLEQLKKSLGGSKYPEHVRLEVKKQLSRLEKMHPEASEYALLRTYLEWISDLPWTTKTKDVLDLNRAEKILNDEHFGLEKAKQRILEYLSVRKLKGDSRGPILCFVGPPGVGKTSLGKSIAHALGRKFFRMSLGGMRDEAEIRGHRRTYVGALPGRIIQGFKTSESANPVFVLDELDKVGADFRGDPAAALLEVLDPQQNKEFRDHYLAIPYDLSDALFIATANTVDTIPEALLDRLEVIYISGYTTLEKENITKRYLIPRQMKENGLEKVKCTITDQAITFLIERYTQEAGVRNLEREVGSLCRKLAHKYSTTKKIPTKITPDTVQELLGRTKVDPEVDERRDAVGLVRGLAWTTHGGEMMPIEVSAAKGNGQLSLTGSLGNVMQESARAAIFYARSNADTLGLDPEFHQKLDVHVHVPNGATPKDGPSAGITIATALVSALSQRPVHKDVAMTGEITLRGSVLPIGGLKEKALAALRYGIKRVIIPFENIKDLDEIPKEQRDKLVFIPVKHIGEVLEIALKRNEAQTRKVIQERKGSDKSRRRV